MGGTTEEQRESKRREKFENRNRYPAKQSYEGRHGRDAEEPSSVGHEFILNIVFTYLDVITL